jgi:chemosensory pili system protein ChpA (sensor histidine kinase/response regulator)
VSTVDTNTLQWVKSEIDETLRQAQTSLEAYVEDTADESQMRFCINYLHQVHGTLQMVELHGAALAIEEMEKLSQAIFDDEVNNKDDAYETLMHGILQVPDYLEHLLAGNPDMPVVLLPLLNDIRAARNEALLSEGALFTPDLSVAAPAAEMTMSSDSEDLPALARKLRHNYHLGLLSWFKDNDPKAGLQKIADVITALTQAAVSDEARRVFWIANGLVESLKDDGVDNSVAVKMLLGHVDRQIKKIIDNGDAALDDAPPEELEKNLLYYIASSTTSGEFTKDIKEAFNLKDIMPDIQAVEQARADLTAPNAALMETVSSVIIEDINKVKDNLDVFVRADDKDLSLLEDVQASLTQMADTLAMLNLGVQRKAVLKQSSVIADIVSGKLAADESELMNVAAAMIAVENSLGEVSTAKAAASIEVEEGIDDGDAALAQMQGAEQQKLMETVLDEAKVNLAKVKDALTVFSQNNEERDQLKPIPALLEQIQGSLNILSLEVAANLLALTNNYIRTKLIKETIPPSLDDMNNLADTISSLEYYMESLMGSWGQPEAILNVAEQSLQSLGINTEEIVELEKSAETVEESATVESDLSNEEPLELTTDLTAPDENVVDIDVSNEDLSWKKQKKLMKLFRNFSQVGLQI